MAICYNLCASTCIFRLCGLWQLWVCKQWNMWQGLLHVPSRIHWSHVRGERVCVTANTCVHTDTLCGGVMLSVALRCAHMIVSQVCPPASMEECVKVGGATALSDLVESDVKMVCPASMQICRGSVSMPSYRLLNHSTSVHCAHAYTHTHAHKHTYTHTHTHVHMHSSWRSVWPSILLPWHHL